MDVLHHIYRAFYHIKHFQDTLTKAVGTGFETIDSYVYKADIRASAGHVILCYNVLIPRGPVTVKVACCSWQVAAH